MQVTEYFLSISGHKNSISACTSGISFNFLTLIPKLILQRYKKIGNNSSQKLANSKQVTIKINTGMPPQMYISTLNHLVLR